jgi:hypothetical protein
MKKLSHKRRKQLEAQGKLRDRIELWVDQHNHKLELIRTCNGLIGVVLSSIIMLRVFGIL